MADASIPVDSEADAEEKADFRRFIDQVSPAELIRNLSRAQRQDNPDGDDSAPDPDAAGSGNS